MHSIRFRRDSEPGPGEAAFIRRHAELGAALAASRHGLNRTPAQQAEEAERREQAAAAEKEADARREAEQLERLRAHGELLATWAAFEGELEKLVRDGRSGVRGALRNQDLEAAIEAQVRRKAAEQLLVELRSQLVDDRIRPRGRR